MTRAPRVYRTEAIVLRRMDLGEADKILTLYTPYLGKLRAVAKGVRKPTSRLGGHVELFTHSAMLLAHGQNLDIVTQSDTLEAFLPLRDDLWRASSALYCAELLDRFTEERLEHYPVFQLFLHTLGWLCETRSPDLTLRYFEVQLLGHLGYRPELYHCLGCREALRPNEHVFSASAGGVLCSGCQSRERMARPLSLSALKVLRLLQSAPYAAVSRLRVPAGLMRELEGLLREYVRFLLERDLKSAAFLDTLRSQLAVGSRQ